MYAASDSLVARNSFRAGCGARIRSRRQTISSVQSPPSGVSQATGNEKWKDSAPLPWEQEVRRFYAALDALDRYLASDSALGNPCERIFQGAIADSLTHVGQLAMLRRLAGQPVRGENYSVADIALGRVGPAQSPSRREFDRENGTGRVL